MIKTVKQHFLRSPYQSLAAILVISLSLFLINAFFLLGAGLHEILRYFETRPQVSAFLKDEARPQEIELISARLEENSKVKKIDYITKEEALEIYREQNKDKPLLLEMVSAKILPASLEVSTYDLDSLKEVAESLKKEPLVEDVIYQEDVILVLSKWTNTARKIGLVMAVFLLFISILTVLIIIGMRIAQRKEEIEILKLLGASSGYICLPFYLEGICYGVLAAVVSWGWSYLAILYATPFLVRFLSGIPLFPVQLLFMLKVLAGLMGLGVLVGFCGSFFAVSRYSRAVR